MLDRAVTGPLWDTASYAVAAALLPELSREGRLEVSGTGKKTRVTVLDAHPFGDHESTGASPFSPPADRAPGWPATCRSCPAPR